MMRLAALIVLGFGQAVPAAAQETAPLDCAQPDLSGTFACEMAQLEALGFDPSSTRLACGGNCLLSSGEGGATFTRRDTGAMVQLGPLTFLHGNQPTGCLSGPFAYARPDGTIVLVSADAPEPVPLDIPRGVPFPDAGSQSCDGRYLAYRTDEAQALRLIDIETGGPLLPEEWYEEHTALDLIGRERRHVLAVSHETDTLILRDLAAQTDIVTDAVFELDQVFLDLDDSHFVIVRRADDPVVSDIYALPDGAFVARLATTLPGGLPMHIYSDDTIEGEGPVQITIYKP